VGGLLVVVVMVVEEAGAGVEWERGAAAAWVLGLVLVLVSAPVGAGVTVRFAEAGGWSCLVGRWGCGACRELERPAMLIARLMIVGRVGIRNNSCRVYQLGVGRSWVRKS
jgi:hypothetical protein